MMNLTEIAEYLVLHLKADGHRSPTMHRRISATSDTVVIRFDDHGPSTSEMGYHTVRLDYASIRIRDAWSYEVLAK